MLRRGHCGRVDENHRSIVKALRDKGWSVQSLATVGSGCPDLLVGLRGRNLLFEVKSGEAKLSPLEKGWHESWRGQVNIVRSPEAAVAFCEGFIKQEGL